MLYKYLVAVLSISTMLWTACDDETDKPPTHNDSPQVVVTIEGDTLWLTMYCGPDFVPKFSFTVHVADTAGQPVESVNVAIFVSDPMEILTPEDSLYITNSEGNVALETTCGCFGPAFQIQAIAYEDTGNLTFHVQQGEDILGTFIVPATDTLFDRPELPDSMEIHSQLIYDWGFPSWQDSTKFTASAGYIDSSYRAYGTEGYDHIYVYWYPTETVESGQIFIYAETKTNCGNWPDNFVTQFLHDTTSFVLAPAP